MGDRAQSAPAKQPRKTFGSVGNIDSIFGSLLLDLPFASSLAVYGLSFYPVLAQLALTLCVHPIVEHSRDGNGSVLLAGAVAAAIGVIFGEMPPLF